MPDEAAPVNAPIAPSFQVERASGADLHLGINTLPECSRP